MPGRSGKKLKRMYHPRAGNSPGGGGYAYIQTFKPFDWQRKPWADTSPVMLLTGSAGGGKSRLSAEKIHGFCLKYPGCQALVLRKIADSLDHSVVPLLDRKVIGDDPRVTHIKRHKRFEYENGSMLTYMGMHDEAARERIRSIGQDGAVDIAWMEEAAEFEEEDFNELMARMRGQAAPWNQIILTTNPEGPGHWINLRLIMGDEATVYVSSVDDNPEARDEYKKMLRGLTGIQYRRLVLGEWVAGSGLVFDRWSDRYNETQGSQGGSVTLDADFIPHGGPVIWTIDDGYSGKVDKATGMFTGKSHPRAIIMAQRRADGTIGVFGESFAIKTLADEHLEEAIEKARYYEWALPEFVVRDRAAAQLNGAVRRVFGVHARYNTIPVEESIKEARDWIAPDKNGVRRLTVHPRCRYTRFQFNSYSYNQSGNIIKQHDDAPDAIRYLIWNEVHGRSGEIDFAAYDEQVEAEYEEEIERYEDEMEAMTEYGVDFAW